jgi:hypothetical protein
MKTKEQELIEKQREKILNILINNIHLLSDDSYTYGIEEDDFDCISNEILTALEAEIAKEKDEDKEQVPCYACQGGGCPVCSGTGYLIQNIDFVEKTLKVLWKLKDNDEFYFMSYGRALLSNIEPQRNELYICREYIEMLAREFEDSLSFTDKHGKKEAFVEGIKAIIKKMKELRNL